jgi:hypothetical protein
MSGKIDVFRKTTVTDRAGFRDGPFWRGRSVDEIKKRLAYEGRDQNQIFGRTLSQQLRAVMRESGATIKPTR